MDLMEAGSLVRRPEHDGWSVEWFRRHTRKRLLRAALPGISLALLGAAALATAQVSIDARRAQRSVSASPTLPRASIVSAHGEPLDSAPIHTWEWGLILGGAFLSMISPFVFALGLLRGGEDDRYIVLRSSGLEDRSGPSPRRIPWAEIEEVRHEASSEAIAIVLRSGEIHRIEGRFAGIELLELSRRIRDVRGKALFDLL